MGMGALALTDLANAFGLIRFYKEARGGNVKPVVGADVWLTNADRDKPARMLLLVQDRIGYLNLCALLSRAWLGNQHRGRAEFEPAGSRSRARKACPGHGPDRAVRRDGRRCRPGVGQQRRMARAAPQHWARVFPQRFYIELQRAGQPHRGYVRRRCNWPPRCSCRWSPRIRCSS
jgi:DNA polymerase-3 subunit alpha